jgi:hypothetical protein
VKSAFQERYETLAKLGSGGMATVHVGRRRGAGGSSPLVAIKRAHEQLRDDPELVRAMKTEAQLAANIHHPNVVGVLDVMEDGGEMVLVLEYVEGPTLSDLSGKVKKRGAPREMLRVLLDAAAGLDAAHRTTDEHGRPLSLVHRDVTPSNVLVGRDGIARIADFGVAKSLERPTSFTATGVLKGKLSYMAPEYITMHSADARSDLFSLGIVVWESLVGDRLFKGGNEVETLMRIATLEVPRLSELAPELAVLDDTVARALARSPEERFSSVGEFAAELAKRASSVNLVATHAEVAALVEGVFGEELSKRRFQFRATMDTVVGQIALPEMWLPQGPEPEPTRVAPPKIASVRPPAIVVPVKAAPAESKSGRHAVTIALGIVVAAMGSGALLAGFGGPTPAPAAAPEPEVQPVASVAPSVAPAPTVAPGAVAPVPSTPPVVSASASGAPSASAPKGKGKGSARPPRNADGPSRLVPANVPRTPDE